MSEETQEVDQVIEATEKPEKKVIKRRAKRRVKSRTVKASSLRKEPVPIPKAEFDETPSDTHADKRTTNQMIKDGLNSINKALIPDENGDVEMKFPVMRDPETKQMMYATQNFRWVSVPPEEVLYYTQSTIIDLHSDHTATVIAEGKRHPVVFDRTYTYKGKVYQRCAWVPSPVVRAGVMYEKKIDRVSRRPVAVIKKIQGSNTPAYQIVSNVETDYRDLKRIYERAYIKRGVSSQIQDDNEALGFMYDSLPIIPTEVAN